MTTNNPHKQDAVSPSAHPIRDFVREMQEQFGRCEYKATSGDGKVVKSPGYIDTSHMRSVNADFRGGRA